MALLLLLALFAPLALLLASGDWRGGVLYSVVVGFLQDPLRKITPNQPGLYVALVLVSIGLSGLVLYGRRGSLQLRWLVGGDRQLLTLIPWALALLAIQAANGLLRFGSPLLTGIGVAFYIAPLIGLWLGFQFAQRSAALPRLLRLHVLLAAVFGLTVWLSFQGTLSGELVREVGPGVQINLPQLGVMIQGFSGLWRSSEIAAWHLGAAACFLIILGVSSRQPLLLALAALLAATLLAVSLLTGRRKVLTLVAGFSALYGLLVAPRSRPQQRGDLLVGGLLAVTLVMLFAALGLDTPEPGSGVYGAFVERAGTVWGDIDDRIQQLGVGSLLAGLQASGGLGLGAGAVAQGAGTLGLEGAGQSVSYAAEGGLGKLVIELGVAGLVLALLLGVGLIRIFARILRALRSAPAGFAFFHLGLLAFVVANLPLFLVASQVYGDPFVLILLGICAGGVLAVPVQLGVLAARSGPLVAAGSAAVAIPQR